MKKVQPVIQSYDWGIKHPTCPFLLPPYYQKDHTIQRIAEIWWGSHPNGCLMDQETMEPIQDVSFLLKLLYVEKPLSLQVHPNEKQLKQHNIFPDPLPKPEIIIATTFFQVLCGFLEKNNVVENISNIPLLCYYDDFQMLFQQDVSTLQDILTTVKNYSLSRKEETYPYAIFLNLIDLYPNDPATLAPFYMNYQCLEEGQALVIPASQPHCYLSGQGIECMPCSDNIVRCGLTLKECNVSLFFQLSSIPQPSIIINSYPYHHACLDNFFSLHTESLPRSRKNSIILVLEGQGEINGKPTKQGDSWIIESEEMPILFDKTMLKVIIAMPSIKKDTYKSRTKN